MSLSRKPKFQVGDELQVIKGKWEGFKFTVIGIDVEYDRIVYLYKEANVMKAGWTEDNLDLSEINNSPLFQALR